MEWLKNNLGPLTLGVLFVFYIAFNEPKEKEKPVYIIEKENVLNVDSVFSKIESRNRIYIDSMNNLQKLKNDSFTQQLKYARYDSYKLQKNINNINNIISSMPNL